MNNKIKVTPFFFFRQGNRKKLNRNLKHFVTQFNIVSSAWASAKSLMEIFILAASCFESPPWAGLRGWTASPMLCYGNWERWCSSGWLMGSQTPTVTFSASPCMHWPPSAGVKVTQEENFLCSPASRNIFLISFGSVWPKLIWFWFLSMGNVYTVGVSYGSVVSLSLQAAERRMCGSVVGPWVAVSRHFWVASWLMFPPEMRGRGNGNFAWCGALPVFPSSRGPSVLAWILRLLLARAVSQLQASFSSLPPWMLLVLASSLPLVTQTACLLERESRSWSCLIIHSLMGPNQLTLEHIHLSKSCSLDWGWLHSFDLHRLNFQVHWRKFKTHLKVNAVKAVLLCLSSVN